MMRDPQTTEESSQHEVLRRPRPGAGCGRSGSRAWARRPAFRDSDAPIPGWEDSAVPPAKLGAYLREFRSLLEELGYHAALYGHFGQGCLHCRIDFDLVTAGVQKWKEFLERAADLVVCGTVDRSPASMAMARPGPRLLPRMYGADLVNAFREFKALLGPEEG